MKLVPKEGLTSSASMLMSICLCGVGTEASAAFEVDISRLSDTVSILSISGTLGALQGHHVLPQLIGLENPFGVAQPQGNSGDARGSYSSLKAVGPHSSVRLNAAGTAQSGFLSWLGSPTLFLYNDTAYPLEQYSSFSGSMEVVLRDGNTFAPVGTTGRASWGQGLVDGTGTWKIIGPTAPPPPITYGLFIGTHDGPGKNSIHDFRQDIAATNLASAFGKIPNTTAYVMTVDVKSGGVMTNSAIDLKMKEIRDQMRPGDNFVLYLGGHGFSSPDRNFGNLTGDGFEGVSLGKTSANTLWDTDLTTMLRTFDGFNKTTFIDACHSGGFWGSKDPLEFGKRNLDSLSKMQLVAAAPERDASYYPADGIGFMSKALLGAWQPDSRGIFASDRNADGSISSAELLAYIKDKRSWFDPHYNYQFMYEGGFGDAVPFNADLIDFSGVQTADFDGVLGGAVAASIPEPETYALLLVGIGAIAARRRTRAVSREN